MKKSASNPHDMKESYIETPCNAQVCFADFSLLKDERYNRKECSHINFRWLNSPYEFND
jgi:hypothetical protein